MSFMFSMLYYLRTNFLPRNSVIAAVGASRGLHVIEMSKLWPESTIYAFEPNPTVYAELIQNLRREPLFNTVKAYNLALGDRNGMANFYLDKQNTSYASSLFCPSEKHLFFEEPIQVPVMTLDSWCESQKVSHIDFLYLDMQGGEGHMLKMNPQILKTARVIELEFYTYPAYEGIVLLDEIKAFLEGLGFKTLYLEPEVNGEVIFVRK